MSDRLVVSGHVVLHLNGEVDENICTSLSDSIIDINIESEIRRGEENLQAIVDSEKYEMVENGFPKKGEVSFRLKEDYTETVELHIDSCGGIVDSGLALIDVIRTSNVPVIAYVHNASSMATLIALSCDYVITYPTTRFMIHELSYGQLGKQFEHEDAIKLGRKSSEILNKIITDNSKITEEELIENTYRRDWNLFGDDIIKYGLTNEVLKYKPSRDLTFYKTEEELEENE